MTDRLRKAAQALLTQIDTMTSTEFARGYDTGNREALRAALAEPEPQGEPVGMFFRLGNGTWIHCGNDFAITRVDDTARPLFAAPPGTVPREVADSLAAILMRTNAKDKSCTMPDYCDTTKNKCNPCAVRAALAAYREAVR